MRKACVAAALVGICGRLPYNRRMTRDRQLILNRYRPIGEAKAGGFGTVRVAWDTRIQRKVAIKCIELDEVDAARAALPGRTPSRSARRSTSRFPGKTIPFSTMPTKPKGMRLRCSTW